MRHGLSLIEVVLAAAILLTGGGASYLWITQDARAGEGLRQRQEDDALARSLLDRYRGLPAGRVLDVLGRDGPANLADVVDLGANVALGNEDDERAVLEARSLAGPFGVVKLRAQIRSRRRSLDRGTLVSGRHGLPQDVGAASGFQERAKGLSDLAWGRAKRWEVAPDSTALGSGSSASKAPGEHGQPHRAQLAWVDSEYRAPPETTVHGEVEAARRLAGPVGLFQQRHQLPEDLRKQRAQRLRRRWDKAKAVGAASAPTKSEEIPDGTYTYSLEVVDLRGHPIRPRFEAVYHLWNKDKRYRLAASAGPAGALTEVAATPILTREGWTDSEGMRWILRRSEALAFAVQVEPRSLGGQLIYRNLPAPDPGIEGTSLTRAVEGALRRELSGAASTLPEPNEVVWQAERFVVRVPEN